MGERDGSAHRAKILHRRMLPSRRPSRGGQDPHAVQPPDSHRTPCRAPAATGALPQAAMPAELPPFPPLEATLLRSNPTSSEENDAQNPSPSILFCSSAPSREVCKGTVRGVVFPRDKIRNRTALRRPSGNPGLTSSRSSCFDLGGAVLEPSREEHDFRTFRRAASETKGSDGGARREGRPPFLGGPAVGAETRVARCTLGLFPAYGGKMLPFCGALRLLSALTRKRLRGDPAELLAGNDAFTSNSVQREQVLRPGGGS
jgi:hypothetical protein